MCNTRGRMGYSDSIKATEPRNARSFTQHSYKQWLINGKQSNTVLSCGLRLYTEAENSDELGWTEYLRLHSLENIANPYSLIHIFIPQLNILSRGQNKGNQIECGKEIIHVLPNRLHIVLILCFVKQMMVTGKGRILTTKPEYSSYRWKAKTPSSHLTKVKQIFSF